MFTNSIKPVFNSVFASLTAKIYLKNKIIVNGPSHYGSSGGVSVTFEIPAEFSKATIQSHLVGKADDAYQVFLNNSILYSVHDNLISGCETDPNLIKTCSLGCIQYTKLGDSQTVSVSSFLKKGTNTLSFLLTDFGNCSYGKLDSSVNTIYWWTKQFYLQLIIILDFANVPFFSEQKGALTSSAYKVIKLSFLKFSTFKSFDIVMEKQYLLSANVQEPTEIPLIEA